MKSNLEKIIERAEKINGYHETTQADENWLSNTVISLARALDQIQSVGDGCEDYLAKEALEKAAEFERGESSVKS